VTRKAKVSRPRASTQRVVGLRVGGRIYRAVFTPDRKAGGYWVKVPKLPGCLTEGDTLAEAKRMTREAIALWVASAARDGATGRGSRGRPPRRRPWLSAPGFVPPWFGSNRSI
jgi:predicted RNase H-like HicB family nuclease